MRTIPFVVMLGCAGSNLDERASLSTDCDLVVGQTLFGTLDVAAYDLLLQLTLCTVATTDGAPSAPQLRPGGDDDTGWSATDNLTNHRTPTFVGTAAAGQRVRLVARGVGDSRWTQVGSAPTNASGVWEISATQGPPAFPEGEVMFAASTDVDGAERFSAITTVTFDYTPPIAPLWPELASGRRDTNNPVLTFVSADWQFDGFTDPLTRIVVYRVVDGVETPIGDTFADPSGVYELAPLIFADDEIGVWARAEDPAGNFSEASTRTTFHVDTQPPARPALPQLDADVYNRLALRHLVPADEARTVIFRSTRDRSFFADDRPQPGLEWEAEVSAQSFNGGDTFEQAIAYTAVNWRCWGMYSFSIKLRDAAGNESEWSDFLDVFRKEPRCEMMTNICSDVFADDEDVSRVAVTGEVSGVSIRRTRTVVGADCEVPDFDGELGFTEDDKIKYCRFLEPTDTAGYLVRFELAVAEHDGLTSITRTCTYDSLF